MPPTMGGKNFPYESGQSGTARPEPVEVTIAPAKIRKSVDAATSFVKRRSQTLSSSRYRTGDSVITLSLLRHLRLLRHPLLQIRRTIDEDLSAHPVVAEATELRA